MEVVLIGKLAALPGFTRIFMACPLAWIWIVISKSNTLITVEGSRLLWWGHYQMRRSNACSKYLTLQRSGQEEPTKMCVLPFFFNKKSMWPCKSVMSLVHQGVFLTKNCDFYAILTIFDPPNHCDDLEGRVRCPICNDKVQRGNQLLSN